MWSRLRNEPSGRPRGQMDRDDSLRVFGRPDGGGPVGDLLMDASGNLYGTTSYGGMGGTAFELSPPPQPGGTWTETVIYTFGAGGNEDGIVPLAGMVFDAEGNLYGTTSTGGSAGGGTVFELSPPTSTGGPWTEVILYNFNFDEDQR